MNGEGHDVHPLWFGVGAVIAIMIGAALGGSFVQERGRRVLSIVISATVVLCAVLGWAFNVVMSTFYAPAYR